jgi:hypothetical protein
LLEGDAKGMHPILRSWAVEAATILLMSSASLLRTCGSMQQGQSEVKQQQDDQHGALCGE